MNMIEVTRLLGKAVREGKTWIETEPGGKGSYDFDYDPTYELEVDGTTLILSDEWCGESQNSGYCYRRFLSCGDFSCRISRLNGVARKLLDRIPVGDEEVIAEAAQVSDLVKD